MQVTHPHPVGDSDAGSRRAIRSRAARTSPPTGGSFTQDMPLPELSIDDLIVALHVAVYHCYPGDRTVSPRQEVGSGMTLGRDGSPGSCSCCAGCGRLTG